MIDEFLFRITVTWEGHEFHIPRTGVNDVAAVQGLRLDLSERSMESAEIEDIEEIQQ